MVQKGWNALSTKLYLVKGIFTLICLFISVVISAQNSDKLNNFVKDWLGTPYRFGGTSKNTGIDCSAFVQRFYKEVYDLEISRTCYYQYQETDRIERENLQTGDILFFKSKVSPSGWHAGIYLSGGEFIHSSNYREGVKISCLYDSVYNRIYKASGRIKNRN